MDPSARFANTPSPLKQIILVTVIASLVAPLLESLFQTVFGIPGPQTMTVLSSYGLHKLWLWQPITHFFVHGIPGMGLTFNLLIEIAFHVLMIWIFGVSLLQSMGSKRFLQLYMSSGIVAGCLASLLIILFGSVQVLSGSTPAMLALLTVWTMTFPDAQILLFFLIPISSRWLLGGSAAAISLVQLSQGDLISWGWMMGGIATGYLFGALALNLKSPFKATWRFDQALHKLSTGWLRPSTDNSSSKIFDIHTGKPVQDDEEEVDRILEKISQQGRSSLSLRERWTLYRASRRRR